jgi:magnesium-protoporphyrin IX monomethyl ester (oxidative) cyclase
LAKKPKVVGCTSTFQQNCASLALLRRIKEKDNTVFTIMGGANCEGQMGQTLFDNFSWIDFVFSGECDEVIGDFVAHLVNHNETPENLPVGILSEKTRERLVRASVTNMDKVTSPDYASYFKTLEALNLVEEIEPGLIVETSRGCWWGAKKHCTFCGLNGGGMTHRSKSAERVLQEWDELSQQTGIKKFEVVDNILPTEYHKTLFPKLIEQKNEYSIFFETKANLKPIQVEMLSKAGVKWIQPGFESLNDDFLKLVQKGVTAIQNIYALKSCRENGVRVSWNILANIPGELEEWYHEMARIVPLIQHLQPPQQYMIKVRYQRFSPYHTNAKAYGLQLRPLISYSFIYPSLDSLALEGIAYFFEGELANDEAKYKLTEATIFQNSGQNALQKEIKAWNSNFWNIAKRPLMFVIDNNEYLKIMDTREVANRFITELNELESKIYRICANPVLKKQILNLMKEDGVAEEEIENVLQSLVDRKLILYVSRRYLALGLKGEVPELPSYLDYPGGSLTFLEKRNKIGNKKGLESASTMLI